jgi:hypothetical protein
MPTRTALLAAAKSLCDSFASAASTLLSHFTNASPSAVEHGLRTLAPFLGREYTGLDGIKDYFSLLQKHLKFSDMKFSDWVVDEEAAKVCCKGTANFTWLSTGQSWDEAFSYMLDFVDESGETRLKRYQVWADSGAVYLASQGKLEEVEQQTM